MYLPLPKGEIEGEVDSHHHLFCLVIRPKHINHALKQSLFLPKSQFKTNSIGAASPLRSYGIIPSCASDTLLYGASAMELRIQPQ